MFTPGIDDNPPRTPTVYTHPFVNVPIGHYTMHAPGVDPKKVSVELDQHGDQLILHCDMIGGKIQSSPMKLSNLHENIVLKPSMPR